MGHWDRLDPVTRDSWSISNLFSQEIC
jgi:hypothetical protein